MRTQEQRAAHAAYMREYSKRRYHSDPEYRAAVAASGKRWRERNRPGYLSTALAYYHRTKTNADRIRVPLDVQAERRKASQALWRQTHKEHIRERERLYREAHRPERAAAVHARQKSYRVRHTRDEWEAKKAEFGYACAYCGVTGRELTRDHVIPIKGGDPNTVDLITNIVPACRACNSRKGNR